jgi:prevent-host-death family protein
MTYIFNMHEAKTKLSHLVELMEAGEEVVIARNGFPVASLVPAAKKKRPLLGEFEPTVTVYPPGFDLDAPIPEWEEAMSRKDEDLMALMQELADEKSPAR